MTDLMFSTGFVPQEKKACIRCLGVNDNPLQQLCDTCRRGDELAAFFYDDYQALLGAAKTIRVECEASGLLGGETCECYEHTGDNPDCPKHKDSAAVDDFENSRSINDEARLGRSADDPRNEPEYQWDKMWEDEQLTKRINDPL